MQTFAGECSVSVDLLSAVFEELQLGHYMNGRSVTRYRYVVTGDPDCLRLVFLPELRLLEIHWRDGTNTGVPLERVYALSARSIG